MQSCVLKAVEAISKVIDALLELKNMQIKSYILHQKPLFSHITPLLKFQKICVDSLKTLGIATKMGIQTELVNTRNNAAAITATNIPSKKNH